MFTLIFVIIDRYSAVEFGHAGGSRKRISYSDREPAPIPGPSSLREHAIDEEVPGSPCYCGFSLC